ncbi:MAG: hypothetical protein PHE96_07455 [Methylococcales bacterium]|nr:hypothetical protein [Methylococcales bacterium]
MSLTVKKSIIELLRAKSGVSIAKFAKNNHVTRQSIYDAIGGKGARRIRVEIARTVEIPPSMIWSGNHKTIKLVDDVYYLDANND